MEQAQVKRRDDHCLEVSGMLTFRTVMAVRTRLEDALADAKGPQQICLRGVIRSDSSALSLWLCLQRWARDRELRLDVIDLPDELRALGRLAGMDRSWAYSRKTVLSEN
ncbi:MAG: STAS domain-containing protein [Marinobacterium sp.]|nr:STAS domain-containing protein [Marinobacterium sp.]